MWTFVRQIRGIRNQEYIALSFFLLHMYASVVLGKAKKDVWSSIVIHVIHLVNKSLSKQIAALTLLLRKLTFPCKH